jgi:hypothetical protein
MFPAPLFFRTYISAVTPEKGEAAWLEKAVLAAIDEDVIGSAYPRRHLHLFSERVVEDRGNEGRGIAGQRAVTLMQPYLIVTSGILWTGGRW